MGEYFFIIVNSIDTSSINETDIIIGFFKLNSLSSFLILLVYDIPLDFSYLKYLQIITEHFDSYPLITQKRADYLLFKQAINIIKDKKHLSKQGLLKLVGIKATLN